MSSIPLSIAERDGLVGGPKAYSGPAPEGRDDTLDDLISEATAQFGDDESDFEDFQQSKAGRDELSEVYGEGGDINKVVSTYLKWDEEFRKNPVEAAEKMQDAGLRSFTPSPTRKDRSERSVDDDESLPRFGRSSRVLDDILEKAITGKAETQQFAATAETRAALRDRYPDLTFSQAIRQVVEADRQLRADPIKTPARIAASYGMPVTAIQIERAQAQQASADQMENMMQTLAAVEDSGRLPHLETLQQPIMEILGRPDFGRTDNPMHDLERAHRLAELQALGHQLPALPEDQQQIQRERIEKAKRAVGIKSSGGQRVASVSSKGGDALDDAINGAMAAMGY